MVWGGLELRARWTIALPFTPGPGPFGVCFRTYWPHTAPDKSQICRTCQSTPIHAFYFRRTTGRLNKGTKHLEMREAFPSKRPDQLRADVKVEAVFKAGESYSERRTGFPGAPRSSAGSARTGEDHASEDNPPRKQNSARTV